MEVLQLTFDLEEGENVVVEAEGTKPSKASSLPS